MITQKPAIDWITATTKNYKESVRIAKEIAKECECGKPRPQNRKMGVYWEGRGCECGYFIGSRMHNTTLIHITVISGAAANGKVARDLLMSTDWKKTRVDVQLTIDEPFKPVALAAYLRNSHDARGAKPNIQSIDNGTVTAGTVYIGSKTSEVFARIYIKEGDEGVYYSRYEIVLKSRYIEDMILAATVRGIDAALASEILNHVRKFNLGGVNRSADFLREVERLSASAEAVRLPEIRVKTSSKTMRWLLEQVDPAIERLSLSHDVETRLQLARIIVQWLGYVEDSVDGDIDDVLDRLSVSD